MKYYVYLGLFLPLGIMILTGVVTYLIPGCDVDSGRGASQGCGALGSLLSAGILGGFMWFMFGLLGLIPALIINSIAKRFSKNNIEAESASNSLVEKRIIRE